MHDPAPRGRELCILGHPCLQIQIHIYMCVYIYVCVHVCIYTYMRTVFDSAFLFMGYIDLQVCK